MKTGSLVCAVWDDHSFVFGDEVNKARACKMVTAGYLVRDDAEGVVIALTVADGVPHDLQFIDRRMLLSLEKV